MFYSGDKINLLSNSDTEDMDVETVNTTKYKKMKMDPSFKSGTNVVNKMFDHQKFAEGFVNFYYTNVLKNGDFTMFREYTEFKYNKYIYKNGELVTLIQQMGANENKVNNFEVLASGSRRFDILVSFEISGNKFSQYFLINNEKKDIWNIKSSIIVKINFLFLIIKYFILINNNNMKILLLHYKEKDHQMKINI